MQKNGLGVLLKFDRKGFVAIGQVRVVAIIMRGDRQLLDRTQIYRGKSQFRFDI
jgi:hypothetical protein